MPEQTDVNNEEERPGIERFEMGVVGTYVREQQYEAAQEQEWFERYAEQDDIPWWMDEEEMTARDYEGVEEDASSEQEEWKTGESTYSPREDDNEAAQQAVYRIKAW